MKHVIFIVTVLVAGVAAGVWFMHGREQPHEADGVADAAIVAPPPPPPPSIGAPSIEAAVIPDAAPAGDDATCDEVSCVLNDYAGACCKQFKPHDDAAVPQSVECDEVSCVLDDYARPCCDRFQRPKKHDAPATDGAPLDLDRTMIFDGVNAVKPRIVACQDRLPKIHGTVRVRVRVAPSGAVSSVAVLATPDRSLGSCVHDVLGGTLFKPTHNGGVFTYPFVY